MSRQEADSAYLAITNNPQAMTLLTNGKLSLSKAVMVHRDWKSLILSRLVENAELAMSLDTPSVTLLNNVRGKAYALAILILLIKDVCNNLNISGAMTDFQIGLAAQSILSDYYWFRISELRYCFLKGMKGAYGRIYDRFDIEVLYQWLSQYDKERAEILHERITVQKNEFKTDGKFLTEMPTEIQEAFATLRTKIDSSDKEMANKLAAKLSAYCSLKKIDVARFLSAVSDEFRQQDREIDFNIFLASKLK